jgi:hypothetical protein
MGVEMLDRDERGVRSAARKLALSMLAIPRKYPLGWAIAWTALLLGLCLAPKRILPDEDSNSVKEYIPFVDLAVHATLFAGFVASWIGAGRRARRWVVVPIVGLLLAVGTEYAQGLPFIHRDPTLLDGLADVFGVVAGLVGSALLCRSFAHSK